MEKTNEELLNELQEWHDTYLEEGISSNSALIYAHFKIDVTYGNERYREFCKWLDKGSAGPYG